MKIKIFQYIIFLLLFIWSCSNRNNWIEYWYNVKYNDKKIGTFVEKYNYKDKYLYFENITSLEFISISQEINQEIICIGKINTNNYMIEEYKSKNIINNQMDTEIILKKEKDNYVINIKQKNMNKEIIKKIDDINHFSLVTVINSYLSEEISHGTVMLQNLQTTSSKDEIINYYEYSISVENDKDSLFKILLFYKDSKDAIEIYFNKNKKILSYKYKNLSIDITSKLDAQSSFEKNDLLQSKKINPDFNFNSLKGFKELRFGDDKNKIMTFLGSPSSIDKIDKIQQLHFSDKGISITLIKNRGITEFSFEHNFSGLINDFLKIGDSEEKIINKYGEAKSEYDPTTGIKNIFYFDKGLIISIYKGKVVFIKCSQTMRMFQQ